MQLLGIITAVGVVAFGFLDRGESKVSALDWHAAFVIAVGVLGAVLLGSGPREFLRTFTSLSELLPGRQRYRAETRKLERAVNEFAVLWSEGQRTQAIEHAKNSKSPLLDKISDLVIQRVAPARVEIEMQNLAQAEIERFGPAADNWELMGRLGPSFGMVGTITGMVTLFKNFENGANLGASMSLALLATLYGIAFGAGIASPIGSFFHRMLDQRLALLERSGSSIKALNGTVAGG